MLDLTETILRLGVATLAGGAIGLNRDLHHKPSGLRTLALVGLGSALAVMTSLELATGPNAASPVIQGVVTGVGFLGAGVIVHEISSDKVRGLTTAAAIWLTACLGCASGAGLWREATVAIALAGVVLGIGGQIEKSIRSWFKYDEQVHDEPAKSNIPPK